MSPQTRPEVLASTPFPPPTPAVAQPPATPPRRHRRWPWIAGGAMVLLLMIGGAVVVSQTVLTHDLLSEDFTGGPGEFLEGSTEYNDFRWVDNAYEISAAVDDPAPATGFVWFARTAYSVEVSADITMVDDPEGDAAVGVSCLDDPNGNQHGYAFLVSDNEAALVRWDTEPLVLVSNISLHELPATPFRVQISCVPVESGVEITGSVDGDVILTEIDPDGLSTFRSAGLEFFAQHTGDAVRFDNVSAVVPEK